MRILLWLALVLLAFGRADAALAVPTATTLDALPNPSVSGQSVTFTASVLGGDPQPPTRSVQFQIDGVDAGGPQALDAGGHASHTTSGLAVGSHTVAAAFQPASPAFDPSHAQAVQQVNKAATDTAIALASRRDAVHPCTLGRALQRGRIEHRTLPRSLAKRGVLAAEPGRASRRDAPRPVRPGLAQEQRSTA